MRLPQVAPTTSTAAPRWPSPLAVLFDRDGTLIHDVPYNGDPALVSPRPGAVEAVALVRSAGVQVGLVTNQSGLGLRRFTIEQLSAVHAQVSELFGGFDVVVWCPHTAGAGCFCRKPRPGLVLEAARHLGVPPARCTVIGDRWSDVEAARRAGARGLLLGTLTPEGELPDVLVAARRALEGSADPQG